MRRGPLVRPLPSTASCSGCCSLSWGRQGSWEGSGSGVGLHCTHGCLMAQASTAGKGGSQAEAL